MIKMRIT